MTIALSVGTFLLGRYLTVNKRRWVFIAIGAALLILGKQVEARFIGLLLLSAAIYSYIPIRNVFGFISQIVGAIGTSYVMVNYGVPLMDRISAPIRQKLIK